MGGGLLLILAVCKIIVGYFERRRVVIVAAFCLRGVWAKRNFNFNLKNGIRNDKFKMIFVDLVTTQSKISSLFSTRPAFCDMTTLRECNLFQYLPIL